MSVNRERIKSLIEFIRLSDNFNFMDGDKCVAGHMYRLFKQEYAERGAQPQSSQLWTHPISWIADILGISYEQAKILTFTEMSGHTGWHRVGRDKRVVIEALNRLHDHGVMYYFYAVPGSNGPYQQAAPTTQAKPDNKLIAKLKGELKTRREVLARRNAASATAQKMVDDLEDVLRRCGELT